MRVISGTARGRTLQPVPGMATRPTTDRVKENIFNLLQEHVRGAATLDLFAGTGQLGIEALSRGAAHCDFVEQATTACRIIAQNIQAARVADRATLHRTDATVFLRRAAQKQYHLIFLDPPYGGPALENALQLAERFDILAANGIIICESAVDDHFTHGFQLLRERRYGATLITVLCRQDGGTDEQYENSDLSGQF